MLAPLPTPAATLYFDFGDASAQTAGNYNNVTPAQQPITDCVDDTGALTGMGLYTSGFNSGSNQNGSQGPYGDAIIFDVLATYDNLFGHTNNFNQPAPRPLGVLTFTNLDTSGSTAYSFTFFGSRMGVTDNRETLYVVEGVNSSSAALDCSANDTNVARVPTIVPTPAGVITVRVSRGPNNNNSSGFFYLGALQIVTGNAPVGLPVITNQPAHRTVAPGETATFSVGVSNRTGVAYQWQHDEVTLTDGGNISGATSATLTVTGAAASDVGHYHVIVTNQAGTVVSAEATLALVGINVFPTVLITGKVGDKYRVDYATALAPTTWIPLSTNVLSTSPQLFVDTTSPGSNRRFYRAVYTP
jgi:hypothetical protein